MTILAPFLGSYGRSAPAAGASNECQLETEGRIDLRAEMQRSWTPIDRSSEAKLDARRVSIEDLSENRHVDIPAGLYQRNLSRAESAFASL